MNFNYVVMNFNYIAMILFIIFCGCVGYLINETLYSTIFGIALGTGYSFLVSLGVVSDLINWTYKDSRRTK